MTSLTDIPLVTLNSHISLHPLSTQLENGVAVIGRGDQFLELPLAGLQFINWLNEGLSLAEAQARFEAAYNPFPTEEVLEVVHAFLASNFIATIDGQALASPSSPSEPKTHLIPQPLAQALLAKPVLIAWLLVCIPAILLWLLTPDLWPRQTDYFWTNYYFLVVLIGQLLGLMAVTTHELSHWLACRAKGIEATITWSHRLGVIPVGQTIMHTIWAVPRSARFLPLAAGMAWDVLVLSLIIYLLVAAQGGLLDLPGLIINLLKFCVLNLTIGLASQFWLFARMDGYFLLSAWLGQRNLQGDTFDWLRSKLWRNHRFEPPTAGMKYVYGYTLIMLLGGGLFLGQFLLVNLPIQLQLLWVSLVKLSQAPLLTPLEFADGLAVLASTAIYWGLLLYAYWREGWLRWRWH